MQSQFRKLDWTGPKGSLCRLLEKCGVRKSTLEQCITHEAQLSLLDKTLGLEWPPKPKAPKKEKKHKKKKKKKQPAARKAKRQRVDDANAAAATAKPRGEVLLLD